MPSGASEYSFSELIPVNPTDEEPSRDIERLPERMRPMRRPRRPALRLDTPTKDGITSPHGLTLLIAGIFIGASLAIAGCVLALMMMGH
jgi:hypothetical protein